MAINAYRLLVFTDTTSPMPAVCDVIQSKSFSMFDALTTSRKWLSASR